MYCGDFYNFCSSGVCVCVCVLKIWSVGGVALIQSNHFKSQQGMDECVPHAWWITLVTSSKLIKSHNTPFKINHFYHLNLNISSFNVMFFSSVEPNDSLTFLCSNICVCVFVCSSTHFTFIAHWDVTARTHLLSENAGLWKRVDFSSGGNWTTILSNKSDIASFRTYRWCLGKIPKLLTICSEGIMQLFCTVQGIMHRFSARVTLTLLAQFLSWSVVL